MSDVAWTRALAQAVEEHGVPNSFGVVELASEYGLKRAVGYRLGQAQALRRLGSLTVEYRRGRFYVSRLASAGGCV